MSTPAPATHTVWIPPLHRDLTGGVTTVAVTGDTVSDVVAALEARYPGLRTRLCSGDSLRPGIAVAVNGEMAPRGLRQQLETASEIHFVPAIRGG